MPFLFPSKSRDARRGRVSSSGRGIVGADPSLSSNVCSGTFLASRRAISKPIRSNRTRRKNLSLLVAFPVRETFVALEKGKERQVVIEFEPSSHAFFEGRELRNRSGRLTKITVLLLFASGTVRIAPGGIGLLSGNKIKVNEKEHFALVIDAGSTGSRIHCFRFLSGETGEAELQSDSFMQLKPGLSSYADNPEEGAKSLAPLIEKCLAEVPSHLFKETSIQVRATAGLRLLPGTKAERLLEEVRKFLESYPFSFRTDSVSIMDGADEGAFAWVTLNYLLGNLGKSLENTVASIDLGGGSVQLAHAVDDITARTAPAGYIHKMSVGRNTFNVYVHSYLGYGLMAGRAEVLEEKIDGIGHPCILKGYSGSYTYGSATFQVLPLPEGSSFDTCKETAASALKSGAPCGVVQQHECSFNGAWGGGRGPGASTFYVSSYFFDRAMESGIVPNDNTNIIQTTPRSFEEVAREVCSKGSHEVREIFPRVEEEHAPYFCLDLSYQYSLLTSGFGLDAEKDIILVKRIEYKGDLVEAAWPLGAALNAMSSV